LDIVDGSEACPSEFTLDAEGKPTSVHNPDFSGMAKEVPIHTGLD
jgi:hypothetical protein